MAKHKCAECGYLGVRHVDRQELVGLNMAQRITGFPVVKPDGPTRGDGTNEGLVTEIAPACAIGAADLGAEFISQQTFSRGCANQHRTQDQGVFLIERKADATAAIKVMHKSRDCKKFRQRIPGLSPKEHIAVDMLDEIQERWRQNDKKQDRKDMFLICLSTFAAGAAWWAALRLPGVPPLPQPQPPAVQAAPATPLSPAPTPPAE